MSSGFGTNGPASRRTSRDGPETRVQRTGILPFALCILFAMPLIFGLLSVSAGLKLSNASSHLARDLASMYHQGVDFSHPESQSIVYDLAHAQGLPIRPDNSVVILSTVRMVSDADCNAAHDTVCANRGFTVLERRIVIGNPRLHASSFVATPAKDPNGWLERPECRVRDAGATLRLTPGEVASAAEAWFATAEQPAGIYVRSID